MTLSERIAAAEAAAEQPFHPEGTEVLREGLRAKVVFSARIPAELSDDLIAEADRCKQTPSALIADLVAEALTARHAAAGLVTVNLADIHRAIDAAARATKAA